MSSTLSLSLSLSLFIYSCKYLSLSPRPPISPSLLHPSLPPRSCLIPRSHTSLSPSLLRYRPPYFVIPSLPPPPFSSFTPATMQEVKKLIERSPAKSCGLHPVPTWLLMQHAECLVHCEHVFDRWSVSGLLPTAWNANDRRQTQTVPSPTSC